MTQPEEILDFWFEETDKENWYKASDAVDAEIITRFSNAYHKAAKGDLADWAKEANSGLALIILLDQFARNMFRGDAQSFAADPLAREYASSMIEEGLDQKIPVSKREFIYMPFMHSEQIEDQDRAVDLFSTKMDGNKNNVLHAEVHREIIKRFGRFPYRNDALGRESSADETSFLDEGGYAAILRELQE